MRDFRIIFVGVGSIAQRHICNIRNIARERGINVTIDAFRRHIGGSCGEDIDSEYDEISSVPRGYDAVFITNPTEMHLNTLIAFHDIGRNFFIEKPVVSLSQIEVARSFSVRDDSVYYVACPLRYSSVIQWIKNNICRDEIISVRSISSSYLPEWRPNQDYRKSYSAHKNMGGGVSIDLIHEWDYLVYILGWPRRIFSMIGKVSDLEIDSDDYAIYIAEYIDKIAELHLDYFGRKPIREVTILTREETIIGDLINNRIQLLKAENTIEFYEGRDDYQKRELIHFFDIITGNADNDNGYIYGIDVLELSQGHIGDKHK